MPVYDVQFVDSISATPTVRLDLRGSGWTVRDGTEFGTPELRRSMVSTLLADGDQYPAAAYGNRVLSLVVRVDGTSDDAIAAQLQLVYRELDRPRNILRYRPGTSSPVFFRTFRAGPDSVVWDPFTKEVRAQIPAEPFGLGLRENLSQVTVSANPAAGSNGCFFDVTGVKGDVETPLNLSLDDGFTTQRQTVVAVRRRGTPSAAPFVLQAESMTPSGSDTALGAANDTLFSGSGQNYLRTTFATFATMVTRAFADPWPAVASTDVRGTYRVFARVRRNVGTDQISLRLAYGTSSGALFGDAVALPAAAITDPMYVDLGLIPFPTGQDPVTDGSGAEIPVRGMYVSVQAQRVSGSGTLDWDYLLFVPADDRLMLATINADSGATAQVIDSARGSVYGVGASGEIRAAVPAQIAGGPPMVSPGVTNRVYFLNALQGSVGDTVATTRKVTPYYWPRYLYARPVAS